MGNHMEKFANSKKGMEMTMQTIVVIVILLVLVVIVLYLLWGRSQLFASSTSCPPEDCATGGTDGCPAGKPEKGLIACTEEINGVKKVGRCCIEG